MNTVSSKQIALEGLRYAYEKTYTASDVLDTKLQNIMNYSSVVVSIASAVMASTLLDRVGIVFWLLLGFVLMFYIATFLIVIYGLKPRLFSLPISQNLETIKKQYYKSTKSVALEQAIVDHIGFTKQIEKENNRPKKLAFNVASWLMATMVIILIIAVPIGLYYSSPTLPCYLHLASCVKGVTP